MDAFTQDNYAALLAQLKQSADEKYRLFNEKLVPNCAPMLGVRFPVLRTIAKELKKCDWHGFLALADNQASTHEEFMLQALVMASADCTIDERLGYLRGFIPKIRDWAVCDTLCGDFKSAQSNRGKIRGFLDGYLLSGKEFELRFAGVMLMKAFITDEYIDTTLHALSQIRHDGYYAKMAVAWAVAECCVNYRDKTFELLKSGRLDDFTQNKAIQKIKESYRVSPGDKERANSFKRGRSKAGMR